MQVTTTACWFDIRPNICHKKTPRRRFISQQTVILFGGGRAAGVSAVSVCEVYGIPLAAAMTRIEMVSSISLIFSTLVVQKRPNMVRFFLIFWKLLGLIFFLVTFNYKNKSQTRALRNIDVQFHIFLIVNQN